MGGGDGKDEKSSNKDHAEKWHRIDVTATADAEAVERHRQPSDNQRDDRESSDDGKPAEQALVAAVKLMPRLKFLR